jgi:LmbE family N-acetylglucosaminyl deacetylase
LLLPVEESPHPTRPEVPPMPLWLEPNDDGAGVALVAHPDDEAVALGGHLESLAGGLRLVYVTDGSPRDLRDARAAGLDSREAYARARRRELDAALAVVGMSRERHVVELGAVDQESWRALARLASGLADLLAAWRPRWLLAHAYEGGHPDHDAAAWIARAACLLLERDGVPAPVLGEFPAYHAEGERLAVATFLPGPGGVGREVRLTGRALEAKTRMLECFETQRAVLAPFPRDVERFRAARPADFSRPPHAGTLWYERMGWLGGAAWRAAAAEAGEALRLRGAVA